MNKKNISRRPGLPKGTKNRGFCDFEFTSLPYREGLGIGGCFFYFFSLRQRKGEIPFGSFRKEQILLVLLTVVDLRLGNA
jgi:hypothetical protein